jgi:phage-related protein (TIGR01555 family)
MDTEDVGGLAALKRDAISWLAGWWNTETGLGDPARDKTQSMQWVGGIPLDVDTLESLYSFNDLAYVIVTALPEWALRHGWEITTHQDAVAAQETRDAIKALADELELHSKQREAGVWGQLYGGGFLLIGAVDGKSTESPIDEAKLTRIEWVRVIDRRDVQVQTNDRYDDPRSDLHGQPRIYTVQDADSMRARNTRWHHSRVIAYPGALTPKNVRRSNGGWDLSVLDRVLTKLALHDGIWANVGAMVNDGSQGVWKIQGLFKAVLSGNREALENRFKIADRTRSTYRSLLVDADKEDFNYVHRQFGGIDGLLAQSAIRTAAAAQMPVTVLFGQSPAGLNATGESDIRLWYDRVEQYQEDVLRPRLERLLTLIFRSKEGPTKGVEPEGWRVTFKPVRKETPMEAGELRARQAQVDAAYLSSKVLAPEEVALSRFTPEGWSAETRIDVKARQTTLKAGVKALTVPEKAPEPQPEPPSESEQETEDSAKRTHFVLRTPKSAEAWWVFSREGEKRGCYATKAEAEERLRQIEAEKQAKMGSK